MLTPPKADEDFDLGHSNHPFLSHSSRLELAFDTVEGCRGKSRADLSLRGDCHPVELFDCSAADIKSAN